MQSAHKEIKDSFYELMAVISKTSLACGICTLVRMDFFAIPTNKQNDESYFEVGKSWC